MVIADLEKFIVNFLFEDIGFKVYRFKRLEEVVKYDPKKRNTITIVSNYLEDKESVKYIDSLLKKLKNDKIDGLEIDYSLKINREDKLLEGIKINILNKDESLYIHTFHEEDLARDFINSYSYSIFNNIYTKMIKYVFKNSNTIKIRNGRVYQYRIINKDTKNTFECTEGMMLKVYTFDTMLSVLGIDIYKFNNIKTFDELYELIANSNSKYLCKEMFNYSKVDKNFKLLNKFLLRIKEDSRIPDKGDVSTPYLDNKSIISLDFSSSKFYNSDIKAKIFDVYYGQSNTVDLMPIKDSFVAYCNHFLALIRKCKESFDDCVLEPKVYAIQDVETARRLFTINNIDKYKNVIVGLSFSFNMDFRGATIEPVFYNLTEKEDIAKLKYVVYVLMKDLNLEYNFYINEPEMQIRLKDRRG